MRCTVTKINLNSAVIQEGAHEELFGEWPRAVPQNIPYELYAVESEHQSRQATFDWVYMSSSVEQHHQIQHNKECDGGLDREERHLQVIVRTRHACSLSTN